ncbi:hypothetical protein BOW53_12040 [Solemya pervernicosa gill symbiont]|uniref:Uncharacterized protein n=2 Tax=Gammaproteobacteria incertae sedis TaxID=118884 RepID=A0A1T2L2H2_9GAMM|nr:hypothetical protein [Candidatus Reidiella endopervernicosa]OOZ39289.1 hypothetical protein BOW53_12040 [Solemya pervernicosa gill symbiont]QKQ25531.1 hypothetical protein HUE57_03875 [Candidatus Reidiella endopervernicosa]
MAAGYLLNGTLIVMAMIVIYFLRHPRLSKSESWQATLTPLSSIIGSGFLIMAPLLASVVGPLSPLAVVAIVILAYSIGTVIRFNILHVEPRMLEGSLCAITHKIEMIGNIALCMAYMVAVAFYLSLLSSFLLNYLEIQNLFAERMLTSSIIAFIAVVGYIKGLGGLEKLEAVSMTIQLAIVGALLLGLFVYGLNFMNSDEALELNYQEREWTTQLRIMAGALLVVQGFETSRFLGTKYSPEVRVITMRRAQIISGVLYVLAVVALLPVVQHLDLMNVKLANIVHVTGLVAVVLPVMLIAAAIMSQFSAAVADTGGAGGLMYQNSGSRFSTEISYVAISIAAIVLVWSTDLLHIITLASQAFAIYYFLQAVLALNFCYHDCEPGKRMTIWMRILFLTLAVLLLAVVFFAIPAE